MSVRFLNAIQTTIASSLIKTDSNGIIVSAVAGTDYVIPSGSITGNAGSATVLQNARTLTIGNTGKSFNGSANVSWTLAEIGAYAATNPSGFITSSGSITGTSGGLLREDNRTISPSELTAGWLKFGFTSWANNNTAPYADFLHLRSYTDSSGGSDNLVMFRKDAIGMRIYQQTWGSSTAYATYKDVAFTDSSITGNAATATTLQTARTLTIGNTGKTFNGGANVSWTLAEIGALGATAKAADSELLDGIDSTGFVRQLSDGSSPDYQTPSSRRVDPNASNPTNEHYAVITYGNNGNVTGQLATHFVTGNLYSRGYNSSWSAWRRYWNDTDFTSTNISNWNAAYGWGNHADAPYWNVSLTDPVQVESTDVTFQGNVTINGTLTENSSIRYKENIKSIGDALLRVNKLNPVTYNKIGVVREEIGLIAEDVFELFPEVVTLNDANQPDGIQYQRLSVILLKALQELTERVNKLENK